MKRTAIITNRQFSIAAFAIALLFSHSALAQSVGGTGSFLSFFNNILNLLTGPIGKSVSVIAVAITGYQAVFGALRITALVGLLIGIILIFSADYFVNQIVGS